MRYVYLLTACLFAVSASPLSAQDGLAIYTQRCASCHDTPAARVPALSAIKKMSGEAIYTALTQGVMKTQGAGLSTAELFALIGYMAPAGAAHAAASNLTATCKTEAVSRPGANTPQWNGWSTSPTNSRFQGAASAGLTFSDVPKLKLKWAFNLGDVTEARSQPTIVADRVFIGTATGALYALNADIGCTHWGFLAATPLRGGVTIGESNGTAAVFFADTAANVYALNTQTGQLLWKTHPTDHYATLATATPRYYRGVVYQSFSSFEEVLAGDPKFECCTFRGSVAALDAGTGQKIWQTFTIPDVAKPTGKSPAGTQQFGPSGAAVWSTPTIDEQLGVLYVSTGDNYSDPPTGNVLLAFSAK